MMGLGGNRDIIETVHVKAVINVTNLDSMLHLFFFLRNAREDRTNVCCCCGLWLFYAAERSRKRIYGTQEENSVEWIRGR